MSSSATRVDLVPVAASDVDAFAAMFVAYAEETLPYDPLQPPRASAAELRSWLAETLAEELQELRWIEADGERAGLLMWQGFVADGGEAGVEITECYVEFRFRGAGVGRAAVEQVLAQERARGTAYLEAGVLRDNPALGFWRALGFEVRAYRTARRP